MADEKPVKNQFSIQKIYVKDVSFESPSAPHSFTFEKWEPQIELNMNNSHQKLNDVTYEVVLTITVTAKNDDKVAFLTEVQQAGIFTIANVSDKDLAYLLASQCMTILFPYARELVSDMTSRGGFTPLLLNPVNFDVLYAQHLEQAKKKQEEEAAVKH